MIKRMQGRKIPTNLVQFETTDGLLLPGLLFEPKKATKQVAINLHGNGSASVFYSQERAQVFARELTKKDIAFFTFNNRGAHYIKNLKYADEEKEPVKMGTAYEQIKDCIHDINGAISFLAAQGYETFYLLGHSTGANKICVYNYYQPENKVAKYVLLGGGDDTGILYDWVGGSEKFWQYLKRAKQHIERGMGQKLIPKYMLDMIMSYQSFYDTCNPDGGYNIFPFNEYLNNLQLSQKELFREFKALTKPTQVVYGELDEYCYGDVSEIVAILQQQVTGKENYTFEIISGADHGFDGHEQQVAEVVSSWLAE